jgi:para-aminobenzoate synthetase/4-amino-4-deoxychorismate lyase
MEIIQELERLPRGIYTGAIGYFAPNGEACFNVAIRTLKLRDTELTMGVGGAIVADSKPQEEYEECNLKATFLSNRRPPFSLIETMRCVAGIPLLSHHIQRLSESADYFGIRYDQVKMLSELESSITHCGRVESRVRMELNEDGQWRISATPMDHTEWHGRLILAADRTRSTDLFLRHKTTNRDIYDGTLTAVRNNGFDEVLFLNESGHITEGAISNLFLRIGDTWITPPLNCGVLPGVQRKQLLKELSNVEEEVLHLSDLKVAEEIFLCNALRGIRAVASIESAAGDRLWQQ